MDDTYEDAICMAEGHVHGSREAEAICSLRWQLEQARKVRDTLQATCDAYEVRLGREMEHRPEIAEPEVPTLLAEIARLNAEVEKNQATFRALSGPILPELLVGIAEGRVHLSLQAQITLAPSEIMEVDRMARAAMEYSHVPTMKGWDDPSPEAEAAREGWRNYVRFIVKAAAPKANTCAPSTEGLLDKEIEDHG